MKVRKRKIPGSTISSKKTGRRRRSSSRPCRPTLDWNRPTQRSVLRKEPNPCRYSCLHDPAAVDGWAAYQFDFPKKSMGVIEVIHREGKADVAILKLRGLGAAARYAMKSYAGNLGLLPVWGARVDADAVECRPAVTVRPGLGTRERPHDERAGTGRARTADATRQISAGCVDHPACRLNGCSSHGASTRCRREHRARAAAPRTTPHERGPSRLHLSARSFGQTLTQGCTGSTKAILFTTLVFNTTNR
jgi:hypothetical protein